MQDDSVVETLGEALEMLTVRGYRQQFLDYWEWEVHGSVEGIR
jgi:hypothetical protein